MYGGILCFMNKDIDINHITFCYTEFGGVCNICNSGFASPSSLLELSVYDYGNYSYKYTKICNECLNVIKKFLDNSIFL